MSAFLAAWAPFPTSAASTVRHLADRPASSRLLVSGDGPAELADTQARGGWSLCGSVRLDDRRALLRALSCRDDARSDEQLVLDGWERFGSEVVQHLVGAYGFVVWDADRRVLHAVRDHMGLQPVYWTRTGRGVLLVSSGLDDLLAHPDVDGSFDERSLLAACLDDRASLREQSVHRSVAKVLPGARREFRADGTSTTELWWRPDVRPLDLTGPEWVDALSGVLQEAVAAVGPGPVGTHASGGLDSSCVAALAQVDLQSRGRRLVGGWSWSPPTDALPVVPGDERGRLERLFGRLGVPVHYTRLTTAGLQQAMRERLSVAGLALLDHEPLVLRSAAEHGVRVLLSGWGGDECASSTGRGAVAGALRSGRPLLAARGALRRAPAGSRRITGAARMLQRESQLLLGTAGRQPSPDDLTEQLRQRGFDPADVHPDGAAVLASSRAPVVRPGAAASQLALLRHGHVTQRIEAWAQLGAAHGVEYRYPLLDRRVLELALRVPDEVHLAGRPRWLFRTAAEPFVGREIAWGQAKQEVSKWTAQQRLLSTLEPVRPDGPDGAADVVEWWHGARRELHAVLGPQRSDG